MTKYRAGDDSDDDSEESLPDLVTRPKPPSSRPAAARPQASRPTPSQPQPGKAEDPSWSWQGGQASDDDLGIDEDEDASAEATPSPIQPCGQGAFDGNRTQPPTLSEFDNQEDSDLARLEAELQSPAQASPERPDLPSISPLSTVALAPTSSIHTARTLRTRLRKIKAMGCQSARSAHEQSTMSIRSLNESSAMLKRSCGPQTTALEDRLKKRQSAEKALANALQQRMESMEQTLFRVRQCLVDLGRHGASLWAGLSVCEKRIELRAERPEEEQALRDPLEEALDEQRRELQSCHGQVCERLRVGQDVRASVEALKEEMVRNKLTFHLDRTSWPQEFLAKIQSVASGAQQFCSETQRTINDTSLVAGRLQQHTMHCLNRRLAEVVETRRLLEAELDENGWAIEEAERDLDATRKQIRLKREAPEHAMRASMRNDDEASVGPEAFLERNAFDLEILQNIRNKIKSAAYTGHGGRQLDVVFARFDRDKSGELDEDEVRRALRRTLKIPPSAVTDAEISALCTALDSDGSGSVSIKEILEFLDADVDLQSLEERHSQTREVLSELTVAQEQLTEDLRRKTATWKIDRACLNVTPIKGLQLDGRYVPSGRAQTAPQRARRTKCVEPRIVEKVHRKLKQAIAGRSLREAFPTLTSKDRPLELRDFLKLLRSGAGLASYSISDAHAKALYAFLAKGEALALDCLEAFLRDPPPALLPEISSATPRQP